MSHVGDNAKALASVIEGLGGTIVDNDSFSFPVNKAVDAVSKLEALGLECKCQREFASTNPHSGKVENVAVFTAFKR